jgi:deoxyribonuclease IV
MKSSPLNVGAHMSIAGGLHLALDRGAEVGCRSIAMFCKSSNQWRAAALPEDEVELFRKKRREMGVPHVVAHASYLVNLASPVPALLEKSRAAFRVEMERCEAIGADYLVFHPGAHMGAGEAAGLDTLAASLDRMHRECPGFRLKVLPEITAGAGTLLGSRFEHLAGILSRVREPERLGFCLDTCHLFAAGYDIRTAAGWKAMTEELEEKLGTKRVLAWHVNDSKGDLGSKKDRHENLGKGKIGKEAFRALMNDPRFAAAPKLLETPKENGMDPKNLAFLRRMAKAATARA